MSILSKRPTRENNKSRSNTKTCNTLKTTLIHKDLHRTQKVNTQYNKHVQNKKARTF